MIVFAISENSWTTLAVVVAIGVAVGISYWIAKKRAAAMEKAAAAMGFTFERSGLTFRNELNSSLHLLRAARNATVSNVMRGPGDSAIFDFAYVSGAGRDARTTAQTVAAYRSPGAMFPEFHLGPEDFLHRAAGVPGYKQISFATHPEFSKRFLLRGSDETAIREFFQPTLLDFFRAQPEKSRWDVEAAGQWLLIYHAKRRVKPGDLRSFAERTERMAREIALSCGSGKTSRAAAS